MDTTQFILFTAPGLRVRDIQPLTTPTLHAWANAGGITELVPAFPCVTSPVQASIMTGEPPSRHGVIANGFYHRDRHEVEFWTSPNSVVHGQPIWEALRAANSALTSAVWHVQNIKEATADFIVTPAPIHHPDGRTELWCYSRPANLYPQLLESFGHFPLQNYWGPLAGIASTEWILEAAAWLIERHAPRFHWIYLPHLDYAAQKFGPDSAEARSALVELDAALAEFVQHIERLGLARDITYLVAGEYALTDVTGVVYPNRLLRQAGLLQVVERDGAEYIDFEASRAFAMVDHQFAHVFVQGGETVLEQAREALQGVSGIQGLFSGAERVAVGLDHPRSGEIILIAREDHWLAYYWWLDDRAAPPFTRTVDIHRKPGYDPVELFFDPQSKAIPLRPSLVKGSHGVPATQARHRTALLCSRPTHRLSEGQLVRDTHLKRIVLELLAG